MTTYKTEYTKAKHRKIVMQKVKKNRLVNKVTKGYKKVKAIRFKTEVVKEPSTRWETVKVKKTVMRNVRTAIKVPVTPTVSRDCCGR